MHRFYSRYYVSLIAIFIMVSLPSYAYDSNGNGLRLPTGYTEVEYIQAPKVRYTTSQVWTVPNNLQESYNYIFEFTPLSWEDNYYGLMIGGNNEGTVFPKLGIFKLDNGWGGMEKRFESAFWNYNLSTNRSSTGANYRVYTGVRSKIQLHCKNYDSSQGAEIVVDNEGYATYTHTSTIKFSSGYTVRTGVYDLPIFTTIDGNTEPPALMQLHIFKVEDKNGKAIYYYVPCKRDNDSKVGLYDVVNGAFYYPSAFDLTAGPEVQNTSQKRIIYVATAGTLPNFISESEKYTIEELTLTGELNGTDFRLLRDMAGNNYLGNFTEGKLKSLDLTDIVIVSGGLYYLDAPNGVSTSDNSRWVAGMQNCSTEDGVFPPNLFIGCKKLECISIPNSVSTISKFAFSSCTSLNSVEIPNNIRSIQIRAFEDCRKLSSITIPNSVTSIVEWAFIGCTGLNSIKVETGNTKYDSRNNCNAIIETDANTLILGCKNTIIPNSVTCIGDFAFYGCNGLTSITIPNSVTTISYCAFDSCSDLTSLTISNNLTTIGKLAFSYCSGLTSITIPNSVTSVGDFAFRECISLTSIKVSSGNTKYDSRNNCNAIIETSSNTLILGCRNTVIPNNVITIGQEAFYRCSDLKSINIPNSVMTIGDDAFYGCSGLTTITIPNSVTSIGVGAFWGCSLTSITIPNSVTSIGHWAFLVSNNLTSVISEIQNPFFIEEAVFSSGTYTKATLTVPAGTKSAYQSTNYWNKFTNIVEKETGTIIQGDVNGDQEVNVSDIVEVVNYINNNASAIFLKNNADLNGDGEVNVTDIVWMVNIIMSAQSSAARTMSNRAGSIIDGDCLSIDDVIINAGETKQVSISLNNPDKKYTAFQFDLTLPDGITIAKNSNGKLMASLDTERKDDHTLSVSELENNTYRFLAFSMSNAELYGTNGPLMNITLEADANMYSRTNAASLKSQVFTATDGTQYKWSDLPFTILVNGSENTSINEISLNGQKGGMIKVYTLTGLLLFSIPQSDFSEKWQALPSGVYIVNGQKMIKTNDAQYKRVH